MTTLWIILGALAWLGCGWWGYCKVRRVSKQRGDWTIGCRRETALWLLAAPLTILVAYVARIYKAWANDSRPAKW